MCLRVSDQLQRLNTKIEGFGAALESLLQRPISRNLAIRSTVKNIIEDVRSRGDLAVVEHTCRLDDLQVSDISALEVSTAERKKSLDSLSQDLRKSLEQATERIKTFHDQQKGFSWKYDDKHGNRLGQLLNPLDRIGIYVPGGRAAYPSSVLMSAIPAQIAGVSEIVMVVPTPGNQVNDSVIAASYLLGIDRVFRIGGAQAIAALAFGTEFIPQVDKIVGPGNEYVAAAKKELFGEVGIDMIAGPSEVVIIADSDANPEWLALDIFSQAEHDTQAQAILISADDELIKEVEFAVDRLLPQMERKSIIHSSLSENGALIKVESLEEAVLVANKIAPEHLQLMVNNPEVLIEKIKHAGAIFAGYWSAEVLGDYCAGPSHVLPTSGTARFSSPLGVYDFQKKTSLIHCSKDGARELANIASTLAECEGLFAHALSARCRAKSS
ncbi:MAG: histidinol dehydrogenase [Acidiferrobacteraceae bacterium]|nr:histidinol dehydrogenase [Acidiferrobacteraceae bacterium]